MHTSLRPTHYYIGDLSRMTGRPLDELTADQLIELYNDLRPVERLRSWSGSRQELVALVRIARKQATPDGLVEGVSVKAPD